MHGAVLVPEMIRTSNEESQVRRRRIDGAYYDSLCMYTDIHVGICIRGFGLYILVYRWEGFGRICIVLY